MASSVVESASRESCTLPPHGSDAAATGTVGADWLSVRGGRRGGPPPGQCLQGQVQHRDVVGGDACLGGDYSQRSMPTLEAHPEGSIWRALLGCLPEVF
jgi:hypothetical protein